MFTALPEGRAPVFAAPSLEPERDERWLDEDRLRDELLLLGCDVVGSCWKGSAYCSSPALCAAACAAGTPVTPPIAASAATARAPSQRRRACRLLRAPRAGFSSSATAAGGANGARLASDEVTRYS